MTNSPSTLIKMLERDTTLAMQGLWAQAMQDDMLKTHGFEIPYRPMELHYVAEENIQIWESEEGGKWLVERLLQESLKGTAFVERVIKDYKPILAQIETYWAKGSLTNPQELKEYFALVRIGLIHLTSVFYIGLAEQTPDAVKELAVSARKDDELFAHGDEFVRDCFAAMGRPRELAYLVLMDEFLGTLPSDDELRARTKGALLIDGKQFYTETLETFAEQHPEIHFKDLALSHEETAQEIKGQIAFKGIVHGKVHLVKNRAQAANIQPGDILVAPMTTPDFLSAMKVAGAFVTDEGGITCHAAIVARELSKPCIIGTRNATKILKDGDEVEVDAEKGIVTILSRK